MSSWGATDADEAKPKFLTTAKKSDTYATPKGWVYRDPSTGLEEVIVAIGGLSGKLNNAEVTAVEFITDSLINGSRTITVDVTFNEAVTITGSPQITVANGDESGDGDGNYTLTYTGTGSTPNVKRFTAASQTVSTGDVLTFGGSGSAAIALNSGTLKDTSGDRVGSIAGGTVNTGGTTFPTATIDNASVENLSNASIGAVTAKVASVAVAAGGSGHAVGDVLTIANSFGTGTNATFTVASVNSGAVTGLTITNDGAYTALASGVTGIATQSTTGSGSGATFNVTLAVESVAVSGAGTGYSAAPKVSVAGTGLDQEDCTVTMVGGDVSRVTTGATAQTVTVTAS